MKRNQLLFWAGAISFLFEIILYLVVACLVVFFIHWHTNKEYYRQVEIMLKGGSINLSEARTMKGSTISNNRNTIEVMKNEVDQPVEKKYYLSDLNSFSFYLTYLQILASSILSILIVKEIRKVLKSVKELETFKNSNIISFRLLGYYCLAIAAVNCIHILATNERRSISFNPGITMLTFMMSAFILAEIFKEGKRLAEVDQLTI